MVLFMSGSPFIGVHAAPPSQAGRTITVALDGASERPGPGDPDGSGTATFTINPGKETLCYTLTVANIDPASATHIHRAPASEPGPVVVPLVAPTTGSSTGCVTVERALLKELLITPEAFYVNVHNPVYPAGAVRGQLG